MSGGNRGDSDLQIVVILRYRCQRSIKQSNSLFPPGQPETNSVIRYRSLCPDSEGLHQLINWEGQFSLPLAVDGAKLTRAAVVAVGKVRRSAAGVWTRVTHCFWDVPKIQTLAAQLRTAWALADFAFLDNRAESERCIGLETWTREIRTVLLANVLRQAGRCSVSGQHVYPKASASRSECYSSCDHARPSCLSVALTVVLTMNARRFQRTHLLGRMGSSLNASKDIGMGVTDFALTCGSEPVVYCSGWPSSHCSGT